MTTPALMFALGLPVFVGWVCTLVNEAGKRPKPFDFEDWSNIQ